MVKLTEKEKKKRKKLLPEGAIVKPGVTDISARTKGKGQTTKTTRGATGRGFLGPNVNLENIFRNKLGDISGQIQQGGKTLIRNPPEGLPIPAGAVGQGLAPGIPPDLLDPRLLGDPNIQTLESQLASPPSLAADRSIPSTIAEKGREFGAAQPVFLGNVVTSIAEKVTGKEFGRMTTEDFLANPFGRAIASGITAVEAGLIAAIGLEALPFVIKSAVAKATTAKVASSSVGIKTVAAGLFSFGVYAGGGKALDWNRGEIQNLRANLNKNVELGERIIAQVRSGREPASARRDLELMRDDIDFAEQQIRMLAIYNVKFRVDKDYQIIEKEIFASREALLRRFIELQTIEDTGAAAFNAQALLAEMSQI